LPLAAIAISQINQMLTILFLNARLQFNCLGYGRLNFAGFVAG
jgi:hypothetical protein